MLDSVDGLTLNSLKKFEKHSAIFNSYKERSAENLFKGLKEEKTKAENKILKQNGKPQNPIHNYWDKFREYNRHQKINYDYLTYLGDNVWEYNDPKRRTKIIIDITNSPTTINIRRVDK